MGQIKSIFLDTYQITYTFDRIQIGCKNHSISEWKNFTDEENTFLIEDAITDALALYEPRAELVSVDIADNPDRNYLGVRVEFRIVNTEEVVVLDTSISRIR